jgi:hypothetical protein
MAVDQPDLIDMMSFDKNNGDVVLTISDHLDWSDTSEHQRILQNKFNSYLTFVESGELLKRSSEAMGQRVIFRVVFKYRPDSEGMLFLDRAREVIELAGFTLRHELFAESHDN